MNLRGCWAAKDGLFVASERPQRLFKNSSPDATDSLVIVIVSFDQSAASLCTLLRSTAAVAHCA